MSKKARERKKYLINTIRNLRREEHPEDRQRLAIEKKREVTVNPLTDSLCVICHRRFRKMDKGRKYCGKRCSRIAHELKQLNRYLYHVSSNEYSFCRYCNEPFELNYYDKLYDYCSTTCRRLATKEE